MKEWREYMYRYTLRASPETPQYAASLRTGDPQELFFFPLAMSALQQFAAFPTLVRKI
jgi:hypothetical protein